MKNTGERVFPDKAVSKEDYLSYLRHVFAYEFAESKLKKNSKVLEVGFGDGYGTIALSNSPKVSDIVAIDVDKETVEYARKKHKKLFFKKYDGKRIPYEDKSFDAVVSFQVIEHVDDVPNYLQEIKRVLKPGGTAFFTTPNRKYRLDDDEEPWNPFHLREYHDKGLEEDLSKIFKSVEVMGVKGTKEINQVEYNRVAQIRKTVAVSKRDIFGIRRLVPGFIKRMIIRMLRKPSPERFDKSKYDVKDFTASKSTKGSLDLLAVCKN